MTVRTLNQEYRCPNGHRVMLTWHAPELVQLVQQNALSFYCIICDESRPATTEEGLALLQAIAEPTSEPHKL